MAQTFHARSVHIGTAAERELTTLASDAQGTFWWTTDASAGSELYVWLGAEWRPTATPIDGITRTVGVSGDHATLQSALDWFKGKNIIGDCYIDVEAGIWDEAVAIEDLFVGHSGALTIRGDTRVLANLSYVSSGMDWIANHAYVVGDTVFVPDHGGAEPIKCRTYRCTIAGTSQNPGPPGWAAADAIGDTLVDNTVTWTCMGAVLCNRNGLTNGGATNGYCQIVGAAGAPTVTVNMYTSAGVASHPDFAADGWTTDDLILVYDNAGTITKYTVSSVAANVLTLTGNLTNSLGDDGTAICLLANRQIVRSTAGPCITVDLVGGVKLVGVYLETSTGAGCDGIQISSGGKLLVENLAIKSEDIFVDVTDGGSIYSDITGGGALSFWGGTRIRATHAGRAELPYAVIVAASVAGVYCTDFGYSYMYRSTASGCATGFWALIFSTLNALECSARQCTTGYLSAANSYVGANNTGNNNCGNTANYSPAPVLPGYAESATNFGVLYASA